MTDDLLHTHLHRLLAKERISERLLDYARGADRLDLDLVRATFHPGAIADYGPMFHGTGAEFADFLGKVHPPMQSHAHHVSNITVSVSGNADGDRAGSEAYVLVRARTIAEDGTVHDTIAHGRYVDEWERRDGEWRISHRRYLHALDEVRTVEVSLFPPTGTRDTADPGYGVLARGHGRVTAP